MCYKEILDNEYEIQLPLLKSCDEIVLYGNTIIYPILVYAIQQLGIQKTIVLFDKGTYADPNYKSNGDNKVIILCGSRKPTRESMKKDADNYFPSKPIFDFYSIYYAWITRIVKRDCDYEILAETIELCRKDEVIHNIDSINTTFCNLNCKECSNGIQFRKEKKHVNKTNHLNNLSKITKMLPIAECNFQGGEVFCDPDFTSFMLEHSKNPRIALFTVATNGTITPPIEFFETMKKTGGMIRISNYGDISKKKEEILDLACKYGIPCFIYPRAEQWMQFGSYKKHNRSESELRQIQKCCFFGTKDMMFIEDKLFCCLRTLYADAAGYDNEEIKLNTLDLKSDINEQQFADIIDGNNLWKMCDYCDYPMKTIVPAEQMKRFSAKEK